MSFISGPMVAIMGSNATEKAAETSANATTAAAGKSYDAQMAALSAQKDIYNQTSADFQPYADVGKRAIPAYEKMLNGGYDMKESPAAKYQLTQGTKALNRAMASRGLSGSGNAVNRLTDLNSSIATSDWSNQYSRILDALKLGTGASSSMGSAGNVLSGATGQNAGQTSATAMSAGNTLAGIYGNLGTNQASLYSGLGGQTSNAAALGLKAYSAYSALGSAASTAGAASAGSAAGSAAAAGIQGGMTAAEMAATLAAAL